MRRSFKICLEIYSDFCQINHLIRIHGKHCILELRAAGRKSEIRLGLRLNRLAIPEQV